MALDSLELPKKSKCEVNQRDFLSYYAWWIIIHGRRIYGGVHPTFTIFVDFWLRSSRYEKDFLQVLLKLSQASMFKFFIFQTSGRWFPWHPKGGCTPPINLEVFFLVAVANICVKNTSRFMGGVHPPFGMPRKPPSTHLKNEKF